MKQCFSLHDMCELYHMGFMATITTSMVLLRWPLLSAVLMFLASTLNIQFRKSDYAGLAVISTRVLMTARPA